jgi:hypothetical protein
MPSGDDDEIAARCAPLLGFAEDLFGKRLVVEPFAGERFFGELLTGALLTGALLAGELLAADRNFLE